MPVLEASHIKPYAEGGPNSVNNGLLLRSDLHILFDLGYLTITQDYYIEVSKKIREEFNNGDQYYRLHGNRMSVIPDKTIDMPAREFIECIIRIWHQIFKRRNIRILV